MGTVRVMKRLPHMSFTTALSLSIIVMCSAVGVHEVTGAGDSLAPDQLIEFLSPTPAQGPSLTFEDRVVSAPGPATQDDGSPQIASPLENLAASSTRDEAGR